MKFKLFILGKLLGKFIMKILSILRRRQWDQFTLFLLTLNPFPSVLSFENASFPQQFVKSFFPLPCATLVLQPFKCFFFFHFPDRKIAPLSWAELLFLYHLSRLLPESNDIKKANPHFPENINCWGAQKREKITQQNLRSKDHRESFWTVLGHLTLDAQNQLEKQNPSPFLRFSWFQNPKLWLYNVYWSRGNCLNNGFWLLRQYLLVQCAFSNKNQCLLCQFLYVDRRRYTHTFRKQKLAKLRRCSL